MKIQVIDTPIAANPWDADVAELIAATDANTEPGKLVLGGIEVPAAEANKARVAFGKAANNVGKTAKLHPADALKNLTADENGNVTLMFSITKKHNQRRGKDKVAEVTEAPAEVAEAPAEVAEAPAEAEVTPSPKRTRR